MVLQNIQADASVTIYVGMVNFSSELAFGGLEGILSGEVDVQEKHTALERRVIWTSDCGLPMVEILFIYGTSGTVGSGVLAEVLPLFLDSFESRHLF